jgi:2-polyprenyl-6-methoxyphenol hydroxylase-like FAD-dependent oxidoreductase
MKHIAIVGAGIGGLHLGLHLRNYGIPVTIYSDKTAAQQLGARLSNVVVRKAPTRARERQLGVNHWDDVAPDLVRLSVSVTGPTPLTFSGTLTPPAQVVDMRIYWATLLDDFVARGGRLVVGSVSAADVEGIAAAHALTVIAAGRGSLANLFPRLPEHSPHTEPQRLVVAAFCRGIRYPDPSGFDVFVSRGNGEILAFPLFSFEDGLTGVGIESIRGGAFAPLGRMRYEDDPRAFEATMLALFAEHAPELHSRIDPEAFGIARPLDVGHVAITPTVRRGWVRLANGRSAIALGDAHILMDPITGQGANKASAAAFVVGDAICETDTFDDEFCARVEQRVCDYALLVSDACNARLQPPPSHVARLLGTAARYQPIADLYGHGFNHPDWYWQIVSSPQRTEALLEQFQLGGSAALDAHLAAIGQSSASVAST